MTSFTDGRVVWPTISYDGKTIVFERDFGVWSLDVATGKAAEVAIALRGVSASAAVEHQTLTQGFAVARPVARRQEDRLHGAWRGVRGLGA